MKCLAVLTILFGVSAAHAIVKKIVIDGNVYALEFIVSERIRAEY